MEGLAGRGRPGRVVGVTIDSGLPEYLTRLADTVWQELAEAVAQVGHPWRTPVVATTGPSGPAARVVVLRAVDSARQVLELHTDARSPKVADIAADPRVAWTFYDPAGAVQVRAMGRSAVIRDGPGFRAAWARVPSVSRSGYTTFRPPGSELDGIDREAGLLPGDAHHFAMVETKVDCPNCNGTGRDSTARVASVRGVSEVDVLNDALTSNLKSVHLGVSLVT